VTFEGPEACGKSTQVRKLYVRLAEEGYAIYQTKQPGGNNPLSAAIRDTLLNKKYKEYTVPMQELLGFKADRIIVRSHEIYPALAEDRITLVDREDDSTVAYQCFGRGLSRELSDAILRAAFQQQRRPDITLLYDAPVERLLPRMHARKQKDALAAQQSRLDDEGLEFHRRVRDGFLTLAREDPDRFVILDALLPEEKLHEQTYRAVMERAKRKGFYTK